MLSQKRVKRKKKSNGANNANNSNNRNEEVTFRITNEPIDDIYNKIIVMNKIIVILKLNCSLE